MVRELQSGQSASHMARRSAMGSLFLPPTLIPRSKHTQRATLMLLHSSDKHTRDKIRRAALSSLITSNSTLRWVVKVKPRLRFIL